MSSVVANHTTHAYKCQKQGNIVIKMGTYTNTSDDYHLSNYEREKLRTREECCVVRPDAQDKKYEQLMKGAELLPHFQKTEETGWKKDALNQGQFER